MTVMKLAMRVLSLLGLSLLAGCEGQGVCEGDCLFKVEPVVVSVDTRLSSPRARAGEEVKVDCLAIDERGESKPIAGAEATVEVEPAATGAVHVSGRSVRIELPGKYRVACRAAKGGVVDATPAELEIGSDEADHTRAVLSQTMVQAGTDVTVTCVVADRFDNPVSGVSTRVRVRPIAGLTVSNGVIRTEKIGEYEVTCEVDGSRLTVHPSALVVIPGAPVAIATELADDVVLAGTQVGVTCPMADAFGNPVTTNTIFVVTPDPTTQDGTSVTAEAVGRYEVACEAPAYSLRSSPAILTVDPGLPASIDITGLSPSKPVYARSDIVEVLTRVSDRFGNEVRAADWLVQGMPSGSAVDLGGHNVMLTADGPVVLEVNVTSATEQAQPVRDTTTVQVDGVLPEIIFDFPRRAEIVAADPDQPLTLRGRVSDPASGVRSLVVNGAVVTPDRAGVFHVPADPSWGINVIEATAFDGAGNRRDLVQAYELASEYRRASPTRVISGKIEDGIVAHLAQPVLDDNSSDVDDLATIARLAIQNADLMRLIPSPVTTYNSDCSVLFVEIKGALRLYVDAVRFGTPSIDVTAIPGGLRLRASIPAVAVDLHTSGDVCDIGLGLRGTASASRVTVEGDLHVSTSGGRVTVTMPSRTVRIDGLEIDLDLPGIIDWAVDGIISLFSGAIANELESAFAGVIGSEVPPVVRGFLESLSLSTGFDLPAPLSTHLGVASSLGMVAFTSGGGEIGFDTTIYAAPAISPEPLGGILQEVRNLPRFAAGNTLAVAVSYDLLNQALYSAWAGGAFDVDVGREFLPAQIQNAGQNLDVQATVKALLPPVMVPVSNPAYPIELQAGDLELDVLVDGVPNLPRIDVHIFASVTLQATASVDASGALVLGVGPTPRIALELTTPIDGVLDIGSLVGEIETMLEGMLPQLIQSVVRGIPLPTFDLSSMAAGYLPPGIKLGLGNARTRFASSYLLLEGNLVPVP